MRGATTLIEMHSLFKCSADYGATMDVVETIPKLTDLNKVPLIYLFFNPIFDREFRVDIFFVFE